MKMKTALIAMLLWAAPALAQQQVVAQIEDQKTAFTLDVTTTSRTITSAVGINQHAVSYVIPGVATGVTITVTAATDGPFAEAELGTAIMEPWRLPARFRDDAVRA